ncbi:MAG: STAS domain-containing protein [bacterium]|jgi:anti-anti-sigma regulatory factor
MPKETCTVKVRPAGRTAFVVVEGYLNSTAPSPEQLTRTTLGHGSRYVILDLTNASELDKEGLKWLSELRDSLESKDLDLKVVVKENSKVRRILKLMQYDRFLHLVSTLFQAWRPNSGKKRTPKLPKSA